MSWLCKLGIHRPLSGHRFYFIDAVSGNPVYIAKCPCGLEWMTDSQSKWFGFKVLMTPMYQGRNKEDSYKENDR